MSDQYLLFKYLYLPFELIALKSKLCSPDVVKTREDWIDQIGDPSNPIKLQFTRMRMNPVIPCSSEHIKDCDIESCRYLLVEADDDLSLAEQRTLLGHILPYVAAVIYSGGRSYHFWVKVDATDIKEYRAQAKDLFRQLKSLGVDPCNSSPSRMSRLPNVHRIDPDTGHDDWQKLFYLNPDPKPEPIFKGGLS